jgi:hypothetical protein
VGALGNGGARILRKGKNGLRVLVRQCISYSCTISSTYEAKVDTVPVQLYLLARGWAADINRNLSQISQRQWFRC